MNHLGLHPHLVTIFGPMYAGKTSEQLRRLSRYRFARRSVALFRPRNDTRATWTHNGNSWDGTMFTVDGPAELRLHGMEYEVVGVDEGQFWGDGLVLTVEHLLAHGKVVLVNGLDTTYTREPFPGPMPRLITRADLKVPLTAVCSKCGFDAAFTSRILPPPPSGVVEVGARGIYEARCGACWTPAPSGAPLTTLK